MIAAWILYALLVGALAGAGALVVENLLRAHRLPTRWVWSGALILSLFWPLGHLLFKYWPSSPQVVTPPPNGAAVFLEPLTVQVTQESFLRYLDGTILTVWVVASSALLFMFLFLVFRTRRLRRAWRGARAGGQKVLFSRDMGPAVVGYFKPEIVLPGWCRDLEEQTLGLIIDHELEHLKAGDLRLILTAGIAPILLPWHAPIWWQYKRLRLAVEGDCDLRVLRKHPERTRSYMELLLQVGGAPPRTEALVAMLSEPEESLERRIRIMTTPFPRKPWARGLLLAGIGGLFLAVACWAPSPLDLPEFETELPAVQALKPQLNEAPMRSDGAGDSGSEVVFTPYTVQPEVVNRAEVARALEDLYPPLLRDAGIGGAVDVWIYIDVTGSVVETQLGRSSGHEALDRAALNVADLIEFTPALNGEETVPVWISIPVAFNSMAPSSEEAGDPTAVQHRDPVNLSDEAGTDLPPPPEGSAAAPSDSPTFTPFTVQPDIRNRTAVARALERNYPPLLRDAGIGGTAQVWFYIDESGVVQRVAINESSGHRALDDAALNVAATIEFTPALNRDEPVPVWISLPITFTTR
jgi:TonB family protein